MAGAKAEKIAKPRLFVRAASNNTGDLVRGNEKDLEHHFLRANTMLRAAKHPGNSFSS